MSTISSREIILEMLKNNGIYMTDPQMDEIWLYQNDWGQPAYKLIYGGISSKEFLSSPYVHSPARLWSKEYGLTEYAKTLFPELG